MTEAEFLERMESVDQELTSKGFAIHQRSLHAFRLLAPGYNGPVMTSSEKAAAFPPFVGPKLLASINAWYERRYGRARLTMPVMGRIPIEIKGQVFLAIVPLVYGSPGFTLPDIFSFVEHLTPDMVSSLTPQEQIGIATLWLRGYELTSEMEDLRGGIPAHLKEEKLFASALLDRDAAVRALDQHHPDLPNACFHAQQLAEKALKAFLLARAGMSLRQMKGIRHKLADLAECCVRADGDFAGVGADIDLLKTISMDVRYSPPPLHPHDAIQAIWAALRVAGLAASKILGCERRFKPGP